MEKKHFFFKYYTWQPVAEKFHPNSRSREKSRGKTENGFLHGFLWSRRTPSPMMVKQPLANAFFARNAANCWRKRRRPLAGCVRWKQNTNVPEVRGERVAPPRRCLPRIGWNMLMSGEAKREPTPDKCTRPFVTRDFVLSTFSHRSTTAPRRSVRSFDPRHRPPLSKPFAAFYLVVPIDENSTFSLRICRRPDFQPDSSRQCLSRELCSFRV